MGLPEIIETVRGVIRVLLGTEDKGYVPPTVHQPPAPQPQPQPAPTPQPDLPVLQPERQLTTRYSLYDLTVTEHTRFQTANRTMTMAEVESLRAVAGLLEIASDVLGYRVQVHSGRRCPELNTEIKGAAHSQHVLCQAADGTPKDDCKKADIELMFQALIAAAKAHKFKFGQLIFEEGDRYGKDCWCHLSLGTPYRVADRCGEVLRAKADATGKMEYVLIERIPQEA